MSWPKQALGEIFEVARGGSPRPISEYVTNSADGLNWIMIGDTQEGSKYIESTAKKIKPEGLKKSRWVNSGDFLLTNSMSFGRPYILRTSGCIHDGWLVLSPKSDQVFRDFFYYLLGSTALKAEFKKRAAGAVVKNLNTKLVQSVKVPLPPLTEQKRIAKILDAADALRAKRRESLAQLDALLQSTFLEMFGDPVANTKGWEISELADVLTKLTDGTHHSPGIVEEGVPYITAKHVKSNGIRFFDNPWYVSEKSHREIYSRCNPEKGDVVYIKDGATTGLAAVNRFDFPFSMLSSLALLKLDKTKIHEQYLCAWLNSPRTKAKLIESMGGAAIKRLTLAKIKKFRIPIPDIELQTRFSDIVESVEAIREKQNKHMCQLDDLFSVIQQKAFQGQL